MRLRSSASLQRALMRKISMKNKREVVVQGFIGLCQEPGRTPLLRRICLTQSPLTKRTRAVLSLLRSRSRQASPAGTVPSTPVYKEGTGNNILQLHLRSLRQTKLSSSARFNAPGTEYEYMLCTSRGKDEGSKSAKQAAIAPSTPPALERTASPRTSPATRPKSRGRTIFALCLHPTQAVPWDHLSTANHSLMRASARL